VSHTDNASVLRARGLRGEYGRQAGLVRAAGQAGLNVAAAETLAVTGPGGCGKPALLRRGARRQGRARQCGRPPPVAPASAVSDLEDRS